MQDGDEGLATTNRHFALPMFIASDCRTYNTLRPLGELQLACVATNGRKRIRKSR